MEKLIVAVSLVLVACVSDVQDTSSQDSRIVSAAYVWTDEFSEDAIEKVSVARVQLHSSTTEGPGSVGWVYGDSPQIIHILRTLSPTCQCYVINHEVLHSLKIFSGNGGDDSHESPQWGAPLKEAMETNCGPHPKGDGC